VVGIGVHKKIEVAEELAVEYARKRAVFMLAEKWNLPDASARLSKLPQKVFDQSIRGAEVKKRARNGEILYVEVAVSIQDIPLRRALGMEVEAQKTPEHMRGILVIPVYMDGDAVKVWGDANPLVAPLKTAVRGIGKEAVIVAAGDREDRSRIDYDNALKADYAALEVLAKRYGAEEILIAIVTPSLPESEDPTSILMERLMPGDARLEEVTLKTTKEQSPGARIAAAADTIARYATVISKSVAEAQRKDWLKLPKYDVEINFTTIQEFGKIEAALRAGPGVVRLELPSIALQHVEGVMYVEGDIKKLRRYIQKQGIKLGGNEQFWTLSLR